MAATTRQRNPLLPLTHAHQHVLRASIAPLRECGQDVMALTQLIEALPHLRAGLSPADRQRIDDLDANEAVFQGALQAVDQALSSYEGLAAQEAASSLLIEPAALRRLSEGARQLAEAAGEVALRAAARASLLE
jgi:hypothetical protein